LPLTVDIEPSVGAPQKAAQLMELMSATVDFVARNEFHMAFRV
jgi:hypothetical protein